MGSGEGCARRRRWKPWEWACRAGLHFLRFDLAMDGFVCACRREHLWAEEIVS